MFTLVDRAVSMVKAHPDANLSRFSWRSAVRIRRLPWTFKQVERAVYNLLLNACQSARETADRHEVRVRVSGDAHFVSVTIIDSGPGVADGIRESLFDPFVSQGKQRGTD